MDNHKFRHALEIASGSLQGLEVIPVLTHFCFDDGVIYAYNDKTATIVYMDHGLRCAIKGEVLLKLMEKDVDSLSITMLDDTSTVRVSDGKRSYVDLPVLTPDYFIFGEPKEKYKMIIKAQPDLMGALDYAIDAAAKSSSRPKLESVTVICKPKTSTVLLYATDDNTAARVEVNEVDFRTELENDFVFMLPRAAAVQMHKVFKELPNPSSCILSIGAQHAKLSVTNEEFAVTVIVKLLVDKPYEFEELFKSVRKGNARIEIPEGFIDTLKRVIVIGGTDFHGIVEGSIKDGKLKFKSVGKYGDLTKVWNLPIDLPDQVFKFNAKLALRCVRGMSELLFSSKGLVFSHEGKTAIVGFVTPVSTTYDQSTQDME